MAQGFTEGGLHVGRDVFRWILFIMISGSSLHPEKTVSCYLALRRAARILATSQDRFHLDRLGRFNMKRLSLEELAS